MMRKTILYVVIAILTVFLAACGTAGNVNLENEDVNMNENESNENNLNDQEQTGGQDDPAGGQEDEQMPLRETSDLIVKALSEQDLETLASYVHPETGVR